MVALLPASAWTQEDAEAKKADIRKLLVITGAPELGRQMMEQTLPAMKAAMPQVSEQFWTDFMAEADMKDFVELVVPIYERHFTHEEVRGLLQFYETPLGQKLIQTMPQILQESVGVGQLWGAALGAKIQLRLQLQDKGKQ
jgi:hypothetical protein